MSLLRKMLLLLGAGSGGKVESKFTNAYFDLIGKIWMQEQGGYMNVPGVVISLIVESPPGSGGGYFNR